MGKQSKQIEAELIARGIEREFRCISSRSSGPGGQNVNKVDTRIEVRFDISLSFIFTEKEKDLLTQKLEQRITRSGEIVVFAQSGRTQLENRFKGTGRMIELLAGALVVRKKRVATKPTASSKLKRIEKKKLHSKKKKTRSKARYESADN